MKKIFFVLFQILYLSANILEYEANQPEDITKSSQELDNVIEDLKQKIKESNQHPQSEVLKKKSQEKQQDFYQKNGLFLGILGGFAFNYEAYNDGKYNRENSVEGATNTGVLNPNFNLNSLNFLFGGKIGYQNFFSKYFGTRIYGDVAVGQGIIKYKDKELGKNTYMLGALNLDLLGEYPIANRFDLGGFLGFSIGLMLKGDEKTKTDNSLMLDPSFGSENILWKNFLQVDYSINVGASFSYIKRHRFEVGFKIPITFLRLGLEKPAVYTNGSETKILVSKDIDFTRSSLFTIGYIYVF
ncbi:MULTISPECIES: outer membrane beta-barrel protein [unclassified Helicobacter]|uniref:outer membrane beta-barrel protein n=1 Tax=unclassified Helicobacter TaxID=2593540 RepID=UPI0013153771|nr:MULTISPECIES: outer membrane beta-barrel protein [unclassified Helicobacter]